MNKAEWKKAIFKLDGGLCRGCGKTADDPHHIVHGWRKKINELWNGICLCRACHTGTHQGIKYSGRLSWGRRLTGGEFMMNILLMYRDTVEDRWAEARLELYKKLPGEE